MKTTKRWIVEYSHEDGRSGSVAIKTETEKSEAFDYGNGTSGAIIFKDGNVVSFDLRYVNYKDFHKYMILTYFGSGLKKVTEVST